MMISVEEAGQLILAHTKDFGVEEVELLSSVGRTLAQPVVADRDFPPYDRVTMDGIAINSTTFNNGIRSFPIEKVEAAGSPQPSLDNLQNCIEVMTGAVLPKNTDAVIPYEQCDIQDGLATITTSGISSMQNVHVKGIDSGSGAVLVEKYSRVTPAMVGIMASVGLSKVAILKYPVIAICSSGDELVEITAQPEPHQVRRSNGYSLAAALLKEGITAKLYHLPDDKEAMTTAIGSLLEKADVLLFSGAVSKGKFDYLPEVLKQLGMKQIFHKVAQKPGKPFLFGTFENGPLVFGFPGNPVSTFVCYQKFFSPWLYSSLHIKENKCTARLAEEVSFKPALSYHLLVQVRTENATVNAYPVTGSNSGDLVTLTKADGLITLPADRDFFECGEIFEVDIF